MIIPRSNHVRLLSLFIKFVQLKSRGYRIELGEIETALYSHPDIEEAAIIPLPDEEIGNQIKPFVVLHSVLECGWLENRSFCLLYPWKELRFSNRAHFRGILCQPLTQIYDPSPI